MPEQTRNRVTGAIFLLALAAIFLPMLFDGAGVQAPDIPPASPVSQGQSVADYDDVVPATDVVERVSQLREAIDDDGYDVATGTRFGEPALTPPATDTPATKAWAVQVASFASEGNARKLRTRLRAASFEAFISSHKSDPDASVMYRVATGPYLSKSQAQEVLASIAGQFSMQPTLVNFDQ
ncbi:MAG: SPOR domain-containing protein [Pseudomonadota bacterium]